MKFFNTLAVLALVSSVNGSPTPAPSSLPYIKAPNWVNSAMIQADSLAY